MMEFKEYMKIKRRMVKYDLKKRVCTQNCVKCAFRTQNNGLKCHCSDIELIDPELAENIVKQWAKEHPQKTYAQDFFEKHPNARKDEFGRPKMCREDIYGGGCRDDNNCMDCWNEPMEESN